MCAQQPLAVTEADRGAERAQAAPGAARAWRARQLRVRTVARRPAAAVTGSTSGLAALQEEELACLLGRPTQQQSTTHRALSFKASPGKPRAQSP